MQQVKVMVAAMSYGQFYCVVIAFIELFNILNCGYYMVVAARWWYYERVEIPFFDPNQS